MFLSFHSLTQFRVFINYNSIVTVNFEKFPLHLIPFVMQYYVRLPIFLLTFYHLFLTSLPFFYRQRSGGDMWLSLSFIIFHLLAREDYCWQSRVLLSSGQILTSDSAFSFQRLNPQLCRNIFYYLIRYKIITSISEPDSSTLFGNRIIAGNLKFSPANQSASLPGLMQSSGTFQNRIEGPFSQIPLANQDLPGSFQILYKQRLILFQQSCSPWMPKQWLTLARVNRYKLIVLSLLCFYTQSRHVS